ncbi:hypothetical protein GcM3_132018 [Golovinomyces cichoracearum]|uniref:Uncharacterized protein n=1 Tax=Golovinomyces cichoracearum TaxID=62708 RepID=A0A420I429_9PEZI|nr:hypothetical protein GcM3_132018 [Golovinomyces cichoracearum]
MRLTRYIHTIICCSVYIFACVKAAHLPLKIFNAVFSATCHPQDENANKIRFYGISGSRISDIFTRREIDNAAKGVCLTLNKIQGCSGFRFCTIENKFIRRPEAYRGTEFSSADKSQFYLSHIYRLDQSGYNDYRVVVQWNTEKRECGGAGVVKKTRTGYLKCPRPKPKT